MKITKDYLKCFFGLHEHKKTPASNIKGHDARLTCKNCGKSYWGQVS